MLNRLKELFAEMESDAFGKIGVYGWEEDNHLVGMSKQFKVILHANII